MARAGHGRIDNCLVRPTQPADVISASPRTIRPWVAWLAVVVLLAVALIGVLVVALHYRQEAAGLHRQLRPVPVHVSPRSHLMTISSDTVVLPVSGRLAGEVTVFAVRSDSRARVVVTARITGGRPDAQYELFGGDCAGNAADHAWAWGTTNSRGSADTGGKAWTVSPGHEYYLIVGTPGLYREHPGPAVHGRFGLARGLSAVRDHAAPCAPSAP
jgi:hypothetical protein